MWGLYRQFSLLLGVVSPGFRAVDVFGAAALTGTGPVVGAFAAADGGAASSAVSTSSSARSAEADGRKKAFAQRRPKRSSEAIR
jgi:hypothetical protein